VRQPRVLRLHPMASCRMGTRQDTLPEPD
jgi:hypothetical protein